MAEFEVSTMDELVNADSITGIQIGDTLKLMNNIDGIEAGYSYPTTLSTRYNIDLNGYTLSNLFLDDGPLSASSGSTGLIKNGNFINIYISPTSSSTIKYIKLNNCIASIYFNYQNFILGNIVSSALDITLNSNGGVKQTSVFQSGSANTVSLSNIVIRNLHQRFDTDTMSVTPTSGNFNAIVYYNSSFEREGEKILLSCGGNTGTNSYAAFMKSTFDCSEISITGSKLNLISFSEDTTVPETITIPDSSLVKRVSESQLRDRAYLESIGFLP